MKIIFLSRLYSRFFGNNPLYYHMRVFLSLFVVKIITSNVTILQDCQSGCLQGLRFLQFFKCMLKHVPSLIIWSFNQIFENCIFSIYITFFVRNFNNLQKYIFFLNWGKKVKSNFSDCCNKYFIQFVFSIIIICILSKENLFKSFF